MRVVALAAVIGAAITLHGCGGGGGGPSPAPAPQPPAPSPPGPFAPIKAITYDALPNRDWQPGDTLVPSDMMQEGYEVQWNYEGRDDLGMMKSMGANTVLVDHALGVESSHDHSKFLDTCFKYGLHVIPGYHTQNLCTTDFDCSAAWKKATKDALSSKVGFKSKNKADWHEAIGMLKLANHPDQLNFEGITPDQCKDTPKNKCWMRAVISMLDGVLQAEKEAGITDSKVNLTAAWSMDTQDSFDGKLAQVIGYFGWYDLMMGIQDPETNAGYTPKTDANALKEAFEKRWTHSMNLGSQTDWTFIRGKVELDYDKYFSTTPWFISAFGTNLKSGTTMTTDLRYMSEEAGNNPSFVGTSISSYQKDYMAGNDDGLFFLGKEAKGKTKQICQDDVTTRTPVCADKIQVDCISDSHSRASGTASAWNGKVAGGGLCASVAEAQKETEQKDVVV